MRPEVIIIIVARLLCIGPLTALLKRGSAVHGHWRGWDGGHHVSRVAVLMFVDDDPVL